VTNPLALRLGDFERESRPLFEAKGGGAAKALYAQCHRQGVFNPELLGLSAKNSQIWRSAVSLELPKPEAEAASEGPEGLTKKALFRLADGAAVECVLVPMRGTGEAPARASLCVSSQVGCRMGCAFCETGRLGLTRSLSRAEIVGQAVAARALLGWDFSSIVFMGMGEPLDNLGELVGAIGVLTEQAGLGISAERITVCTSGIAEGIEALGSLGLKRLGLSLSLNAGRQETREALMPITRTNGMDELALRLSRYPMRRNFYVALNYCLIPGANDSREEAAGVGAFAKKMAPARGFVNLIPYNPGSHPLSRAPTEAEVGRFLGWLAEEGLQARARGVKGRDIMAACGQLAGEARGEDER
jgi:23S rRNA (adenine2503-C2)-methyltransferase